jgi:hypothetical protein
MRSMQCEGRGPRWTDRGWSFPPGSPSPRAAWRRAGGGDHEFDKRGRRDARADQSQQHRAVPHRAALGDDGDGGERDADLDQRRGHGQLVMAMLVLGAFLDQLVALGLEVLGAVLDLALLVGFGLRFLLEVFRMIAALLRAHAVEVLLDAVGLVLAPGIGRLVLLQHRLAGGRDGETALDGLQAGRSRREDRQDGDRDRDPRDEGIVLMGGVLGMLGVLMRFESGIVRHGLAFPFGPIRL